MRAHLIDDGMVVNTVEVVSIDDATTIWPDLLAVEATVGGIGWLFDGQTFSPPPPPPAPIPVPAIVSMRQARLALLAAGHLSKVNAALAALPSPQKEAAQIEWEYATEVRRESDLVKGIGAAIGLDAAALDALFIAGAKL